MLQASVPTALESELRFERYSNRARLIGRDPRDRRLLPREDRVVDGQSGVFVGQIVTEPGRGPDFLTPPHPEVHQAVRAQGLGVVGSVINRTDVGFPEPE